MSMEIENSLLEKAGTAMDELTKMKGLDPDTFMRLSRLFKEVKGAIRDFGEAHQKMIEDMDGEIIQNYVIFRGANGKVDKEKERTYREAYKKWLKQTITIYGQPLPYAVMKPLFVKADLSFNDQEALEFLIKPKDLEEALLKAIEAEEKEAENASEQKAE